MTYYSWLKEIVAGSKYRKLCNVAHNIIYDYKVDMDENWIDQCCILREIYLDEYRYIHDKDLDKPISLFEVLVAMAYICDRDIMYNANLGYRYNKWFSMFMENLFDMSMHDILLLSADEMEQTLYRFMNRAYDEYGRGGCFPLRDIKGRDQRTCPIWMQMNMYLVENVYE